jgi:hypothetical protein
MTASLIIIAVSHAAALAACGLARFILPALATVAALYLAAVLCGSI